MYLLSKLGHCHSNPHPFINLEAWQILLQLPILKGLLSLSCRPASEPLLTVTAMVEEARDPSPTLKGSIGHLTKLSSVSSDSSYSSTEKRAEKFTQTSKQYWGNYPSFVSPFQNQEQAKEAQNLQPGSTERFKQEIYDMIELFERPLQQYLKDSGIIFSSLNKVKSPRRIRRICKALDCYNVRDGGNVDEVILQISYIKLNISL